MEAVVIKTKEGHFIPAYDSDWETAKRIPVGAKSKVSYVKSRNYQFLKRFMAMIRLGHDNTTMTMPFDAYRKWATMKAGYYHAYETHKGIMFEAKSIAFEKMEAEDFEEVYSDVLDVIIADVGLDHREIEEQLIRFM